MTPPLNVLFLCTDQQRRDSLSVYGNRVVRTPAADRLAREGTAFDQAYTPSAICTPTRASFLTGVWPFRHKLLANFERNVGYITELPDGTDTFARRLREAGYRVGHVGKWHVGQDKGPAAFGLEGEHYPGWGPPVDHPDYLRYLDQRGLPRFSVRDELRARGDNFYHWMTTMFEVDVPGAEDASLSGFGRYPSPPPPTGPEERRR
jgi:arylsulfatase A-like enzyme